MNPDSHENTSLMSIGEEFCLKSEIINGAAYTSRGSPDKIYNKHCLTIEEIIDKTHQCWLYICGDDSVVVIFDMVIMTRYIIICYHLKL